MPVDRLEALLERFSVRAQLFHSGEIHGVEHFGADCGRLHLLERGRLQVDNGDGAWMEVDEPSLLLYPRPRAHRFRIPVGESVEMACANLHFSGGPDNPLTGSLPPVIVLPLKGLEGANGVLRLIFQEAFGEQCGRRSVVDRLFEVLLVLVLRALMERGQLETGLFAAMRHPGLARALVAMHEAPGEAWSLDRLAETALMSRSHLAETFRETVGRTPGEYLLNYRMLLARDLLADGVPLAVTAEQVGYAAASSFSRAFSAHFAESPSAWRRRRARELG
jgi:AraC-like DNA-binding protein